MMKGIILALLLSCICIFPADAKGKTTYISVEIQGYTKDMVYLDFMEKSESNLELPYQENQVMEVEVELDDITMLRINTWIYICLQPGDTIHARIVYDGKYHKSAEYTGTPEAVAIATALQKVREARRAAQYKANIPAALVTLTEAKDYHAQTLAEWKKETGIIGQVKDQISPDVYHYVLSELDAVFLTNLINYPYASASFHKKNIADCMTPDYWDMLNAYRLRDDRGSLHNQGYMSFLLTYKEYMRKKEAAGRKEAFVSCGSMEEEYADIAGFYEGPLREVALFVFLYNVTANNGDFDRINKLVKDYLKKYNKNKEYKTILSQIMK